MGSNNKNNRTKKTYDIENVNIFADLVSLAYILYMRLEAPENVQTIPAITTVPQMIANIVEEKKYALAQVIQPRHEIMNEINGRMKNIYLQVMEQYRFDREEKELGWLLLHAYSSKECQEKMKTSDCQYRYAIRKMCSKTKTSKKEEMVTKIRQDMENPYISAK